MPGGYYGCVNETAFSQMTRYIDARDQEGGHLSEELRQGLRLAREEAEENGVPSPSATVGNLLAVLATATSGRGSQGAVAITPAAGVVGLHILAGLPQKATLTCIEPEAALQAGAKQAFREAGFAPSRVRFLTARPLDVMSRLANGAYQLVYADVASTEFRALLNAAWPLLAPGGTLVIAGSLLDGTVGDTSRRERDVEAARECEGLVDTLALEEGATVTRLPLDGGLTLIAKPA